MSACNHWPLLAAAVQIAWTSLPHSIYVNGPQQGWALSTDSASSYSTNSPLGIMGGENAVSGSHC